jgi:hypothetical protein
MFRLTLEDSMILLNLAVVGALAAGSLAFVNPPAETGPTSAACVEATAIVEARATEVAAAAVALADAETGLGEANAQVQAKLEILVAAQAALSPEATEEELSAFTAAQLAFDAAVAALVAGTVDPALTEDLSGKRTVLAGAVTAKNTACAAPAPPASTPPANVNPPADCDTARELGIPLPIRAGDPRFGAELDDDRDGLACEPGEGEPKAPAVIVPDGAPRTGGW